MKMEWIIKKEHDGMLIREYLQVVHGFSRRIIKRVKFDGGEIIVNGAPQTVRYCLAAGDKLQVHFPPEKIGSYIQPEELDLTIVYEDEAILVIDKSPGVATIPSLHHPSGTVANGLLAHYEKNNIPFTVHVVTRLDRDTSGLMLIAKHRYSHSLLAALQKARKVKRKYKAIIEGMLTKKEGIIDAPIGRKEDSIIERVVRDNGKRAITHYKVIQESFTHSLINIQLGTGRTHQIRVHFSSIGHPLAGDNLYGGSTDTIDRQALHCYELSFEHPSTKEVMEFQSLLPKDMHELVEKMQKHKM